MNKLLNILDESYNPNIYQVECTVAITAGNRPIPEVLSDIRAVPGVTVVNTIDSDYNTEEGRHLVKLSIKIDPSPFNPFDSSSYDKILSDIKKLPDVRGAKFTSNPIVAEGKLHKLIKEVLQEKADRCKRIADRKYDKPSAYKSGAIVRCRKGNIWKDIKEGSEEEAWEFVLSPDPNIKKIVQQAKLSDKEEDIKKVTSLIDSTKTTTISSSQIAKLKNFNNKPGEESLIKDMVSVSKSQNPRQSYTDYMKKRDEREGRNRGYDPVQNFDNVVKGDYEPPVLININGTLYVIGGRTRLYAGLAANKSMNVKIIDISQLKEALTEKQKETLRTWFKRKGAPGKEGGWVDCNTCRKVDGKTKCKSCGRKKGEKRAKYPSCRPTPSQCKQPGKGKKWGKTK